MVTLSNYLHQSQTMSCFFHLSQLKQVAECKLSFLESLWVLIPALTFTLGGTWSKTLTFTPSSSERQE